MTGFRPLALDHVVLRVADLERARAFYCGALGCVFEKWQEPLGLLQLRAGASLIQMYTGFAYAGPVLPRRLADGLAALLKRDGFTSVADAVGKDA